MELKLKERLYWFKKCKFRERKDRYNINSQVQSKTITYEIV